MKDSALENNFKFQKVKQFHPICDVALGTNFYY